MRELTSEDILWSFDTESLPIECLDLLTSTDFSFRVLEGGEKEECILDSLKQISDDKQRIGEPSRTEIWEKGWRENLDAFRGSGNLQDIVPKFIRPNNILRFKQSFIKPRNDYFERDYCRLLQLWLFDSFMKPYDSVYEFGCGSGFNLVTLADMFPKKRIIGTDFVQSSVDLVNEIARTKALNLEGFVFDMIKPGSIRIAPESCVFTFGAIEQLAGKFHSFVQYLIDQGVSRCVHIEPLIELYDEDNLVDYLAIMSHRKRGYTEGFLPFLQEHESINLMKVRRLYFGNHRMEGYSCLVWEPK